MAGARLFEEPAPRGAPCSLPPFSFREGSLYRADSDLEIVGIIMVGVQGDGVVGGHRAKIPHFPPAGTRPRKTARIAGLGAEMANSAAPLGRCLQTRPSGHTAQGALHNEELKMSKSPIVIMAAPSPKLCYSIDEAAEATSIGRSSLYEDVAAGLLTIKKRGRSTVILAPELARYLMALPDGTG